MWFISVCSMPSQCSRISHLVFRKLSYSEIISARWQKITISNRIQWNALGHRNMTWPPTRYEIYASIYDAMFTEYKMMNIFWVASSDQQWISISICDNPKVPKHILLLHKIKRFKITCSSWTCTVCYYVCWNV